jgi:predicted O-linked N-acetylglucosamine transferase (SPINDLY family)
MFRWFSKKSSSTGRPEEEGSALPAPFDSAALRAEADALLRAGDLEAAASRYLRVLESSPSDSNALTNLGFVRLRQGQPDAAVGHLSRAAELDVRGHDAPYMLGVLHEDQGRLDLAVDRLRDAVARAPTFEPAVRDLSRVLYKDGRAAEARATLEQGIRRNPAFADYHFYLGNVQLSDGEVEQAAASYALAVDAEPGHVGALVQLGITRDRLGATDLAAAALHKAVALSPGHASAQAHLGAVCLRLGQPGAAVAAYEAALVIEPRNADVASSLGNALRIQGRLRQALQACKDALALDPDLAAAHNNAGNVLVEMGRASEALPHYERAMALRPDSADAARNLGHALITLKRPLEALAAFERARAVDPQMAWLLGDWLHTRMSVCDWADIDLAFAELARRIDEGAPVASPFAVLAAPLTAGQQLRCFSTYVRESSFPPERALPPRESHGRIRLGYFSADFHGHATAYLMAGLFELHDRNRFELFAFSFGPRSQHPMRARLEQAFDQFIEVSDLSDVEIADRARELGIDIAIDLKGYTQDSRPGIFSSRAAPVQVAFMGFPGTMGAPFIDYMVADPIVVPPQSVGDYSEKVVFLPHSYQMNDARREVSPRVYTRTEAGLPERGFVFCCLNNSYKITPDVFEVWMRLLKAVPGSVLWLLQDNPHAASNLAQRAVASGVARERLAFAPRLPMPEHLARQRLADLFLDTRFCNAHTTASDALWVGLPVVSCMGATFASRVAGSLLHATGLAELAVDTLEAYESLALSLAQDPERLAQLRRRLQEGRDRWPLFDSAQQAHHVEEAYSSIWRRHLTGLPPDHIRVAESLAG